MRARATTPLGLIQATSVDAPASAPDLDARFRQASRVAAALLIALGVAVLLGWALDITALKQIRPSFAAMKPNTAITFVLLGGACWFARDEESSRARRWLGLLVAAIGTATFLEDALLVDLGIDQLLFRESLSDVHPGRMAPITAASFAVLGIAVLGLDTRARFVVGIPIGLAALAAFLALLGYLYGSRALYSSERYSATALHTAVGVLLACFSLLAARPQRGIMAVVASPTGAGALLRGLLPLIVSILVLFGWLELLGEVAKYYDETLGSAMLVASSTVLLGAATAFIATRLYAAEQAERRASIEVGERERAIRESEARKSAILNSAFDAIVSIDERGLIVEFNPAAEQLFGYSRAEAEGRQVVDLLVPPALRDAPDTPFARNRAGKTLGRAVAFNTMRADGREVPVEIAVTRVEDQFPPLFTAFIRDRSERQQVEQMKELDRFFRLSIDLVCIADETGHFVQVSPSFEKVLGYRREELLTTPYLKFVHPDDRDATLRELESLIRGVPTLDFRNRYLAKDGTYHWLQWRVAPEAGLHYAVARDITEDLRIQERLRATLLEREALLQEVHHRVKNNLQLISSLINLQVRPMEPGAGRTALEECQSRVQTIALIHQKLHQSRDYERVPFSDYLKSLAFDIFYASGASPEQLTLAVEADTVRLSVDKAIPAGLIVNELLVNALRHAFPDHRPGHVAIVLRKTGGEILLSVADDGVGMPDGLDLGNTTSLGLELVNTLVEQLRGRTQIEVRGGTTFRITFPLEAAA